MHITTLQALFKRDLEKLKTEIQSYSDEKILWHTEKSITNSAGNLCLHIIGNLNAFIGAALGNSNYVRQRDLEFSLKDVPRSELIQKIDETIATVQNILSNLSPKDLENQFPIQVSQQKTTTAYFLAHLTTHLSYHLGQINYHRRLLDE
ncbi:MAG: DinB family protein [Bacteroidota bacterium]